MENLVLNNLGPSSPLWRTPEFGAMISRRTNDAADLYRAVIADNRKTGALSRGVEALAPLPGSDGFTGMVISAAPHAASFEFGVGRLTGMVGPLQPGERRRRWRDRSLGIQGAQHEFRRVLEMLGG